MYTNNSPLISIVIPTRNRKELLLNTLSSVINQSYCNIQIIIHDNNTKNLEEHDVNPKNDARIEFYKSKKDLSLLENWRSGIQYVKGEYFLRLDDDNLIDKEFIKDSIKIIQKYKLKALTANYITTCYDGTFFIGVEENNEIKFLNNNEIAKCTIENIIDTNYSIYDYKYLIEIFGSSDIYQTNLPDRFLDLRLAGILEHKEFAFINKIYGLSRQDHTASPVNSALINLEFEKINELCESKNLETQISPHVNFTLSRVLMFKKFYESKYANKKLNLNKIISEKLINLELHYVNLSMMNVSFIKRTYYFIKTLKYILQNKDSNNKIEKIISKLLYIYIKNYVKPIVKLLIKNKKTIKWQIEFETLNLDELFIKYRREGEKYIKNKI